MTYQTKEEFKTSKVKTIIVISVASLMLVIGGTVSYINLVQGGGLKPENNMMRVDRISDDVWEVESLGVNLPNTSSQTQTEQDQNVTTTTNNTTQVVEAVKTEDLATKDMTSIVNNGNSITITKSIYNAVTGNYDTSSQTIALPAENIREAGITYGKWIYTGVAIGDDLFATIINTAPMLFVSEAAVALKISISVAKSLIIGAGFSYASYKYDIGKNLAKFLDKNHNGWIGVYTRQVSNYIGHGQAIQTTDTKTE